MTVIPSEVLAETHLDQAKRATAPRKSGAFLRRVTAMTVAVSVMLASAVPSYADKRGDDIAKALAAALIIGAIVNGIDNNNDRNKPKPEPVRQKRVPSVCAIEIDSDRGRSVTVYTESCLRDEGFRRLPDCGRSIRIYGQRDRIYSEQCLRDAGYRVGRHH